MLALYLSGEQLAKRKRMMRNINLAAFAFKRHFSVSGAKMKTGKESLDNIFGAKKITKFGFE